MQCWWKDTHTSVEITDWENIFANPKSETGFITRIYKELKIQRSHTITGLFVFFFFPATGKRHKETTSKEDTCLANNT